MQGVFRGYVYQGRAFTNAEVMVCVSTFFHERRVTYVRFPVNVVYYLLSYVYRGFFVPYAAYYVFDYFPGFVVGFGFSFFSGEDDVRVVRVACDDFEFSTVDVGSA